jgi:hypothetical protein
MPHNFRMDASLTNIIERPLRNGFAHSTKRLGRLNRTCVRASEIPLSSGSTSGSFSTGPGKTGVASVTQPSASTATPADSSPRPLASSETIKDAQGMAKLFLLGELASIFETGVSPVMPSGLATFLSEYSPLLSETHHVWITHASVISIFQEWWSSLTQSKYLST